MKRKTNAKKIMADTSKIKRFLFISIAIVSMFGCDSKSKTKIELSNVFFAENFDGIGPGLKAWKLYGDNNKISVLIDSSYANAWVEREMFLYNGNPDNKMAVSASFFEIPNKADRWMISPEFEVGGYEPYIYWEECAPDPITPQGYEVLVSPDGGTSKESFTEKIYETPVGKQAESVYTFRSVSLAKYKGKKIRLAFINNWTKGFLISIDNIFLSPFKITSLPNMVDSKTISKSAVDISWKDVSPAQSYDLALVPFGEKPTFATHTASSMSYKFEGLNAASHYQCYIKSPRMSQWIGPYPVQTAYSLPVSTDLNTNMLSEGWIIDGLKKIGENPIDKSKAVFIKGIAGDVAMGDLISPPIELKADEPITISYDYFTEGTDGNIIVWISSMDSGDRGMLIDGFELENAKIGEKQHRSFTVTPIAESGVFSLFFKLSVYGEKKKDDMRIYIDNISIKRGK